MSTQSILIVDDEPEVCTLLGNYLQRKVPTVASSSTLADALVKYQEMKPGILILDHNMPDGLGIDEIPKFRSIFPNSKVVVISAMSNLREKALLNGADHFLEKPITFSSLNNIISGN